MKKKKRKVGGLFWIAFAIFMVICIGLGAIGEESGPNSQVTYDSNMQTTGYEVQIEVREDNSYFIQEHIDVNFLNERHGIYRYIPVMGCSIYKDQEGETQKIPYYVEVTNIQTSAECNAYEENGSQVMQLGSEDRYVYGPTSYQIAYEYTPVFQQETYSNIYLNIYPTQWQNEIPEGSRFQIMFPKELDPDNIQFYYGPYGSVKDAKDILSWKMQGNVLTGKLTETLPLGSGLTIFSNVGEEYFESVYVIGPAGKISIFCSVFFLLVIAAFFLLLGRDEKIIPSIQYQPPEGMDSAAVGYIIDGVVEDRDVISLIIYWADKGYLSIYEDGGKIQLKKRKDLPGDAPVYQKTMFQKFFKKKDEIYLNTLKYKFSDTMNAVKEGVKLCYSGENRLYTRSSAAARVCSYLFCGMPMIGFLVLKNLYSYTGGLQFCMEILLVILLYVGVFVVCWGVDRWYGKSSSSRRNYVMIGALLSFASVLGFLGIYITKVQKGTVFNFIPSAVVMTAVTGIMIPLVVFMKKRTHQCVEWMGYLAGLRDFIETAELERMKVMAEESPQLFYHIIPYAYVFGLSEVFAEKMRELALDAPEWYHTTTRYDYFDYYMFHRAFSRNLEKVTETLTVPKPETSSGSSSGNFGGGGFSGGGFSGGGFGGGGGGSW